MCEYLFVVVFLCWFVVVVEFFELVVCMWVGGVFE